MNKKMTAIALSLLLAGGTAAAQGNPYEQFAVQFADGSVISAPDANVMRTCNVRVAFPDPFGGSQEVAFDVSWVFNPRSFTMEPYHAEEAAEDCLERPMPEVPAYIYEGQQYEGPEGYGEPQDDQYDDHGEYGPENDHHDNQYGPDGGHEDQPYGDHGPGEYGPHEGGDDYSGGDDYYPEGGEWEEGWDDEWEYGEPADDSDDESSGDSTPDEDDQSADQI